MDIILCSSFSGHVPLSMSNCFANDSKKLWSWGKTDWKWLPVAYSRRGESKATLLSFRILAEQNWNPFSFKSNTIILHCRACAINRMNNSGAKFSFTFFPVLSGMPGTDQAPSSAIVDHMKHQSSSVKPSDSLKFIFEPFFPASNSDASNAHFLLKGLVLLVRSPFKFSSFKSLVHDLLGCSPLLCFKASLFRQPSIRAERQSYQIGSLMRTITVN